MIIYNAPGNDDPKEVDDVLLAHGDGRVRFVEGEIVELAPGMEMLSTGYTNVTPWNTHREYTEDEIRAHLAPMIGRLEQPGNGDLQHPRAAVQLPAGHGAADSART